MRLSHVVVLFLALLFGLIIGAKQPALVSTLTFGVA